MSNKNIIIQPKHKIGEKVWLKDKEKINNRKKFK